MPNLPGMSTTAIGSLIHKKCENASCGRVFETYEPHRNYCSLKCKDYAARRRRLLREKMTQDGHDPRLGTLQKEREEMFHEEAVAIKNNDPKAIERVDDAAVKFLFDAVVNQGKTELMNAPHISAEIKQRVNKMLLERAAASANTDGSAVAAPSGSYIVTDTESVLKDLGFLSGDQPTEQVAETSPTEEEKARDL